MDNQILINRILIITIIVVLVALFFLLRPFLTRYVRVIFVKSLSVEFSPIAIFSLDIVGLVVAWNRGAEKLLGYKEREVLGKTLVKLMPERYAKLSDKGVDVLLNVSETDLSSKPVEICITDKYHAELPIVLTAWRWKDKSKLYYTCMVRDVSIENKVLREHIAELQLYKEGEKIDMSGIWDFDPLKDVVKTSTGFQSIFNVGPQEAAKDYFMKRVHFKDRDMLEKLIERAFETGEGYEADYGVVSSNASIVKVHCKAITKKNDEGKTTNLLGTIRIIT